MSYQLNYDFDNSSTIFIVGFSTKKITLKSDMLKFLDGLGYAIHIAAFEEESIDINLENQTYLDLDNKENLPRSAKKPSFDFFNEPNKLMKLTNSIDIEIVQQTKSITDKIQSLVKLNESESHLKPITVIVQSTIDEFIFPIHQIEPLNSIPDDLTMNSFTDIKHIADGSNADISIAKYNDMKVIIKMIKETSQDDYTAIHEFEIEYNILNCLSHPNIIKLIGSGQLPRRFIVLEYLEGGTLNAILSKNQQRAGFTNKIYRQPSFTYANLLERSLEIANALNYLHSQFHEHGMVIHRGLLALF